MHLGLASSGIRISAVLLCIGLINCCIPTRDKRQQQCWWTSSVWLYIPAETFRTSIKRYTHICSLTLLRQRARRNLSFQIREQRISHLAKAMLVDDGWRGAIETNWGKISPVIHNLDASLMDPGELPWCYQSVSSSR